MPLADQRRFHVHDPVAVDLAVDEVAREGRRHRPAVRHRLGVHVASEDNAPPGAEAQFTEGVGPVVDRRLQLGRLKARVPHDVVQEVSERPLFTEDAGDAADLLDELYQTRRVDRGHGGGYISHGCAALRSGSIEGTNLSMRSQILRLTIGHARGAGQWPQGKKTGR
jgi:hypothetical protein